MELVDLAVPSTLPEIVWTYRQFKHAVFENWSALSYDVICATKIKFFKHIVLCAEKEDAASQVRVCIGVIVLTRYSVHWRESCTEKLRQIRPDGMTDWGRFITTYIAKYYNMMRKSGPQPLMNLLSDISLILHGKNHACMMFAARLLYELASHATRAIDGSDESFFAAIVKTAKHDEIEVRFWAVRALRKYLRMTRQRESTEFVRKEALNMINETKTAGKHGGLLIMACICDFFPEEFDCVPAAVINYASQQLAKSNGNTAIVSACYMLVLANASREAMRNVLVNRITDVIRAAANDIRKLRDMSRVIIFALKKVPLLFDQVDTELLDLIRTLLLNHKNDELNWVGARILGRWFKFNMLRFSMHYWRVMEILLVAKFNDKLVRTLKLMMNDTRQVGRCVRQNINQLLRSLLSQNEVEYVLELIANLNVEKGMIDEEIFLEVLQCMYNVKYIVRVKVPAALIKLIVHMNEVERNRHGLALVTNAMVDPCSKMRVAILEAFTAPYPDFLAHPTALKSFEILLNDECFKVRHATLRILGAMATKNPVMIYPMFRSTILDTLSICREPRLLRVQVAAIGCLPIIFSLVPQVLEVYLPAFVPVAIEYLKKYIEGPGQGNSDPPRAKKEDFGTRGQGNRCNTLSGNQQHSQSHAMLSESGSRRSSTMSSSVSVDLLSITTTTTGADRVDRLTFFEREFSRNIVVCFIESIECACKSSFHLVESEICTIIELLLGMISRATHRGIILATTCALSAIVDRRDALPNWVMDNINMTLLRVGARVISSKVHLGLFRLLGNIGTIRPPTHLAMFKSAVNDSAAYNFQLSHAENFALVVGKSLLFMLGDTSEAHLHTAANTAISRLFGCSEGLKCAQRLFGQYLENFLSVIRRVPADKRPHSFEILHTLLNCPREWLRPFAAEFFELIKDLWHEDFLSDILKLIPHVASALGAEFLRFVPEIISMLLGGLDPHLANGDEVKIEQKVRTVTALCASASNFVFMIVRKMIDMIYWTGWAGRTVVHACLECLRVFTEMYDCTSYASQIVRACITCTSHNQANRDKVIEIFIPMACRMGDSFSVYAPLVTKHNLMPPRLSECMTGSTKHIIISPRLSGFVSDTPCRSSRNSLFEKCCTYGSTWKPKDSFDGNALLTAIQSGKLQETQDGLKAWLNLFVLAFIRHSPSPAIQSAIEVAEKSRLFSRKIFNAAFLSCWCHKKAETIRPAVGAKLALAFWEGRSHQPLISTLLGCTEYADRAQQSIFQGQYSAAKRTLDSGCISFALYCAWKERISHPTSEKAREHTEAAYRQLGLFNEMKAIEKQRQADGTSESIFSKITKLEQAEKWSDICKLSLTPEDGRDKNIAFIRANAYMHMHMWSEFEATLKLCSDMPASAVLRAQCALRRGEPIDSIIDEGFRLLWQHGGPLFAHGFSAVAPFVVEAQKLVELQEYVSGNRSGWDSRLKAVSYNFNTILPLLRLRIDILGSEQSFPEKLMLLRRARKANEWEEFEQFLTLHFENDPGNIAVEYERVRLLGKRGQYTEALKKIDQLTSGDVDDKDIAVRAKLLLTGAVWTSRDLMSGGLAKIRSVRDICARAIKLMPNHYRIASLWGWVNMKLFDLKVAEAEEAAVLSIKSFAQCTKFQSRDTFSDVLQMCSLLFRSSLYPQVLLEVKDALEQIEICRYFKILPQLQIYQRSRTPALNQYALKVISRLLDAYPNTVIFALLFIENLEKDNVQITDLIQEFEQSHSAFTKEARTIWESLQRTCLTLPTYCAEGLNQIFLRADAGDKEAMKRLMDTYFEYTENQTCAYDRWFMTNYKDCINTIRKLFYDVWESADWKRVLGEHAGTLKRVHTDLMSVISRESRLSLKDIAPKLQILRDSMVTIPGTARPGKQSVMIARFGEEVSIKGTKQRPRVVKMLGNNGKWYKFLLKGKEDLRQDQRVIQFFELVNAIVPSSAPRIAIADVTPFTPSTGVIQWIPKCETIHEIIQKYRVAQNKPIDIENTVPEFEWKVMVDSLRPIHRLEQLRQIFATTSANDLKDVMWLTAPDADEWVIHVTNYTKTLAMMSMVGYVIGLGDRHPANLMLHRQSGSITHIDFGDCFEVTKERPAHAERIPFRLTRMMVAALGPCGVDGSFRKICEETLTTIREHREAVMAVLEVFMREPVSTGGYFERITANDISLVSGSVEIGQLIEDAGTNRENDASVKQQRVAKIMTRMTDKINGLDFENTEPMTVAEQVEQLICAARDEYNLAYVYHGWNPTW